MSDDNLNKFGGLIDQKLKDFGEVVREEISASEQRLKEEMAVSDKRVMADIGSFMEDTIIPLIDEKADKTDIERLERKLDRSN